MIFACSLFFSSRVGSKRKNSFYVCIFDFSLYFLTIIDINRRNRPPPIHFTEKKKLLIRPTSLQRQIVMKKKIAEKFRKIFWNVKKFVEDQFRPLLISQHLTITKSNKFLLLSKISNKIFYSK